MSPICVDPTATQRVNSAGCCWPACLRRRPRWQRSHAYHPRPRPRSHFPRRPLIAARSRRAGCAPGRAPRVIHRSLRHPCSRWICPRHRLCRSSLGSRTWPTGTQRFSNTSARLGLPRRLYAATAVSCCRASSGALFSCLLGGAPRPPRSHWPSGTTVRSAMGSTHVCDAPVPEPRESANRRPIVDRDPAGTLR